MKVGIIRYPGSNCDFDAKRYFNNSFFIWHKETTLLEEIDLLVLPGGFAFGDRLYDKATGSFVISPGTMALQSPVSQIINQAVEKNIPILGICNGFQILTQMKLLPGELILNKCTHFVCKKVNCNVSYNSLKTTTEMYIANSYGNYVNKTSLSDNHSYFLKYDNGDIGGVCDLKRKIFGMMPHPERNNYEFKHILHRMLFDNHQEFGNIYNQLLFDKTIKDLMFSEHISYKTTRKYLRNLHTKESWVVQGPGENAGIVDIGKGKKDDNDYCIAIRIESHNHPTYINPFEGAATGVGGILRDIFTMGARPIALMDFLRFGTDQHSENLLNRAIEGIAYYGNCIGVPIVGGDCKLHESFNTNPLVNVACLGIVKKNKIIYGNALTNKSYLIYVGSKTGNEGINGAAMASNTFVDNKVTNEMHKNVQKSDPFLEKLLLEACCEISEMGIVEGMQDMGAGGLLCATLEVIKRGRNVTEMNMGCEIYLDQVPIKYDMEKHNILISESQERMLIVCQDKNLSEIGNVFKKWDLEYAVIGCTNTTGEYKVLYNDDTIYSENMNTFNDIDDYTNIPGENSEFTMVEPPKKPKDVYNSMKIERYDATVGNRTIKGPDKPGKYSILDIHEVGKQLILTWGESFDESYDMMKKFEGVKPLCLVNCLNFGDPKNSLYDFSNTIDDLTNKTKIYSIPIVGGNVSLYNTTGDKSIYPTPILVMMGISR